MFNIGFSELVLISIIALIFIGPKQIPEVAKTLGNFMRDIKRASNEFQKHISLPAEHVEKIKSELHARVQKVLDEKPASEKPAEQSVVENSSERSDSKPEGTDNG